MKVQILVAIISFILTVITSIIVIPILKKHKLGQVVRDDGPRSHLSKSGTPTMGGISMLIVICAGLLILSFFYPILVLPLIAIGGFGLVGFIDDRKKIIDHNSDGISPKTKMILLFVVTTVFILVYFFVFKLDTASVIPFLNKEIILPIGLYVFLIAFALLGGSNAVNLTDGLDGLAAGIVAIAATFFTLVAVKTSDTPMIILGSTIGGSTLAFLIFNIKPAKVFMGDTGSLALGGAIVSMACMMKMPLYLIIVLFIPIVETLSVAAQVIYFKATKGKRLLKMAPLHHHLELSGLKEEKIVILFWFLTFILCVIAYII